ncbi:hypothetical protein KAFR_0B02320 [Kazachstania africana CBS 2517]|uniref:Uncharacterized protein n=1 Tax=Kazachstania africana (strain ATCC 22294 / BCRC 22015 / CBS 2517 / CECT 1963 / NBRC 1671 / NRRL Y-8276) TaxID=1071382 RepID=H2AQ80_KAZAF|nr:hypothetical protein KAFR_0B02320 [Kazachstania africana CBS 2517]CCF56530.1 hypothetical protein KAFR_0B02320 [Kazachstania africana CBS 2517]
MNVNQLHALAMEYKSTAYAHSTTIECESELTEYFTLIKMSVATLTYIKAKCTISFQQEFQITMEIIDILLNETFNFDLVEDHIVEMREKLRSYSNVTDYILMLDFVTLYTIPLKKETKFQYNIALRNCDQLLNELDPSTSWFKIFKYVDCCLCMKLGKTKRVIKNFNELLALDNIENISQFNTFILLSFINFHLEQRLPISDELLDKLNNKINSELVGERLFVWKLILQMIIKIYNDENITNNLNAFKEFFASNKDKLTIHDPSVTITMENNLSFQITHPGIFNYKDLKNVLLFLQSISYLTNCYDPNSNFSTKFLPKVFNTTTKLIKAIDCSDKSISFIDFKVNWYNDILLHCEFYKIWENLLLNSNIQNNMKKSPYTALLDAISTQIDSGEQRNVLEAYSKMFNKKSVPNEIKLICLLNSYTVVISKISKTNSNIEIQEYISTCNEIWAKINTVVKLTDIQYNNVWDCTITILWIISHFEAFTENPLPSTDGEKSEYITKLNHYYENNKLLTTAENVIKNEAARLKKSLLLQILINYLGGRIIETDLNQIYQISHVCFKISKLQKMKGISYITGLWHLMNCTIAMKSKEVAITKAKLESLLSD